MRKHITIVLLILQHFAFSQKSELLNYTETITLITNTKTIVTGEKLLYSLFCNDVNNKPSELSKVAYVACLNEFGKEVFSHKHYLNKSTESGSFFIPSELKTGNYKIIAYTKWMLNKSKSNYFEQDLLIINPYLKTDVDHSVFNNQTINDSILNNLIVKKSYKKRKIITFNEFKSKLEGQFTTSVRKTNEINFEQKENTKTPEKSEKNDKLILPETKGEIISGKISSSENQLPLNKIGIALTDKGNNKYLNTTITNNNGEFYFILPKPLQSENITIEVITENPNYSIVLDPETKPIYTVNNNQKIQLKENYTVEIKNRAIAAQIENAYYEIKKDSIILRQAESSINNSDLQVFDLDNITRFSSLKEFIIEVINQVYFTEKEGDFKLRFRNSDINFEINEDPLTIVDGNLIHDSNDLLKIEFSKVSKISINNKPHYLGNKLYSGLFIVNTADNSFNDISNLNKKINLKYNIPFLKEIYYFPDYTNDTSLEKIPDYRVQLYWKTNISSLQEPIEFSTSDIEGTYEISTIGYTNDGQYINKKSYFIVK
ncbi:MULTISPECIES: hypothetical protein [Flavobacterium]|uniref:Carboxypeptidase regulatory-like domain-containing protein n=1 Tax=Flavobacterium jumunjinense TaxID=998845 RepID=A0ABV5GT33_9FLAO|nr:MULTISPECIES: hypothetical protein [Flavobacterium]